MIDFQKANPSVTKEEYMWSWTIPQIKLASYDTTHVEYLPEKDKDKGSKSKPKEKVVYINSIEDAIGVYGAGILDTNI